MRSASAVFPVILLSFGCSGLCQQQPQGAGNAPIYHVTVVERTAKAINYAYRGDPTKIDFRGTVLMPQAHGDATVESLRGRTEIDAKFENLLPSSRFGREYLTYTLWAITPEGAPHNIAEIVPDGSDKAKLHVSTALQAFGLIVTAEPYSAARKPSDVVVLENEVRPDTVGKIETINAKYELLPRGEYTWQVPPQLDMSNAPKVSMSEYEAILELYEAQNAVGIARSDGADRYAPDTLAKAQGLLNQAQQMRDTKVPTSSIVETARESAQTAEDARELTDKRRTAEKLAAAENMSLQARQAQSQAQAQVSQAQAEAAQAHQEAAEARAQGQSDRQALNRAQAEAADMRAQLVQTQSQLAAQSAPPSVTIIQPPPADPRKVQTRRALCDQLNGSLSTLDTPRGIVVTISDPDFNDAELKPAAAARVAQIAGPLAAHPDLQVTVEGYSDSEAGMPLSEERAEAVRRALRNAGLPADRVVARGMGNTRHVDSPNTAWGREANRRVEIVITGDAIGNLPVWEKPYSISPK